METMCTAAFHTKTFITKILGDVYLFWDSLHSRVSFEKEMRKVQNFKTACLEIKDYCLHPVEHLVEFESLGFECVCPNRIHGNLP